MKIDSEGLDEMDRKYMSCIANDFHGGPVGIETISAALLEHKDIIEDVIEPYLMQRGLVQKEPLEEEFYLKKELVILNQIFDERNFFHKLYCFL